MNLLSHGPASSADGPLVAQPQHRIRSVAAGLVASVAILGVAGMPTVASAAVIGSSPVTGSSPVKLADWSQGGFGSDPSPWGDGGGSGGDGSGSGSYGSGGYGSGGYGSGGYGSGSDGGGSTTVDSQAATAAESKGVVLIDTVLTYAGAEAAGTGMVITSNGEVLTNYHVVEGATKIAVTVASTGKTYSATVVGHDQSHDVALLQLKDASGLDTVAIGNESVTTGDQVTAVGNAGGTGSLTAADGTVTSLTATVTTAAEGTVGSETLKGMIETDADVVAGDSGGPLIDSAGEVVGIDTAASTGAEIDGYAIPIKEALAIVDQIRSGADTSSVKVGAAAFLGVLLAGDQYGTVDGATLSGVVADGPAAKAGLVEGDTITRVGSHTISSASELSALLATYGAGDRVKLSWTDTSGDSHSTTVTLAASPVA